MTDDAPTNRTAAEAQHLISMLEHERDNLPMWMESTDAQRMVMDIDARIKSLRDEFGL